MKGSINPLVSRRMILRSGSMAALAAAAAACGSGGSPSPGSSAGKGPGPVPARKDGSTLNLFAWQGYFAPSTIKGFEKKYGITVNQTYITSGDDELQKVVAGLPFDVAITNSTTLPQVAAAKLLRPIGHGELSNWDQVIPYFQNPYYDPGAKYSVGYAMAPIGIAYRTDKFPKLTGSWSDLWTYGPKDAGHVYMLNDMQASMSIALMHLGLNQYTSSPSDLSAAAKSLIALKPKLGGFASTNTIQIIASGEAAMIPSYTGNVYTALLQAKNKSTIRFELCREGQLFNADTMAIPASAAHPGNGMLFIDWMLAPENMTANVNYIGYPVPTTAAMSAYNALVKNYPWLSVGTDLLSKPSAWEKGLTQAQRSAWNAAWLTVQA